MSATNDTPRFAVGDRVRCISEPKLPLGIVTSDERDTDGAVSTYFDVPPNFAGSWTPADDLTLVARAHYAPTDKPDAVPAWVTPEQCEYITREFQAVKR
jgi:hypothetical protein